MKKIDFARNYLFLFLLLFVTNFSFGQLTEDFSSGIPEGWEIRDIDGDGSFVSPAPELDGRTKYAGGNNLGNDFLITPKLSVTASNKTLSFDQMTYDYDGDYTELKVYVVNTIPSDNNYDSETPIFDDYLGDYSWTTTPLDLTAYIGQEVFIVFNISNEWGPVNFGGIDNVSAPALAIVKKPEVELTTPVFENTIVGSSTKANLTIKNTGNAALNITDILVDAPFSIVTKTLTIAQASQQDVEITFSPTIAGAATKMLSLTIDGEFDGTNTIELNAMALAKKPTISLTTTDFDPVILGSNSKAILSIENIGNADLNVSSIDINAPFSCTVSLLTIIAGAKEDVELTFNPETEGVFNETITVNITGEYNGTNTINVSGSTYVPDVLFEDFEAEEFPPLGWTVKDDGYNGWHRGYIASSAYEGGFYAYAGPDGGSLTTPKLNIKDGDEISFYAHNSSSSNGTLSLKYSTDNSTWSDLQDITLTDDYTKITVDLSSIVGEKFIGFFGKNYVFVDNVSGPEMLVPATPYPASNPTPIDQAQGLNNMIKLSWNESLCADGYKICLGTSENPIAVLDNVNVGTDTEYMVHALDFATNYIWKVIPYNNGVDAEDCPVWRFTTMADPTINNFPYTQGFEKDEQNPGWIVNNWFSGAEAYMGDLSARTTPNTTDAVLMTAPINLPSDFCIHFYWKNDDIDAPEKNSKVAEHDTSYFEVSTDFGKTWTTLRTLSPEKAMTEYQREIVNLSDYAGDNVYLRWHYVSDGNVQKAYGVGLDAISIQARPTTPVAEINNTAWEAGVVDFGQTASSENIFEIINIGVGTLEITSANLSSGEFSTSFVKEDVALLENETYTFSFDYNPTDAGSDTDKFTIICSSGETFKIDLTGKAHSEDFTLWDIEEMEDFATTPIPWRTINADKLPTWGWSDFDFPHEGDSLAFIVFNPKAVSAEGFTPHSKNKFLASIAARGSTADPVSNNDWLISPHGNLGENPEFSFWAKSSTDQSGLLEKFNVAVSTTGYQPSDFKIISGTTNPIEAPASEWTKYNFDLSEFKGENVYVAIQCVSFNNFIFMVDDLCLYDFSEINDAPNFISTALLEASENRDYLYNIKVNDDNFDKLTITSESTPAWLTLTDNEDGTASLSGKPLTEHVGTHNVKLTASDGKENAEQTFTISVSAFANTAPEFTSEEITSARRGIAYLYDISVKDADEDNVTIGFNNTLPSWLNLTANGEDTETLSGTPTEAGDFDIELTVSDGFETTIQKFTITVSNPLYDTPKNLTANIVNDNNVELNWKNPTGIKLMEDFEGTWPPANWEIKRNTNIDGSDLQTVGNDDDSWFSANENSFGTTAHPEIIYNGKNSAGVNYSAKDFNWLITPEINIENEDELRFWLYYVNGDYEGTYYFTKFHVLVEDNGSWNEILFLTEGDDVNNYEKEIVLDLSEYANKSVKIAFVYEFNNSFALFIDDIRIAKKTNEEGYGSHTGYKVYRNDEEIAQISDILTSSYLDETSLEDGDYTYYVTATYSNPDGESEASNKEEITINTNGISDKDFENSLMIYPNPSNGQFTIKTDAQISGDVIVNLYDLSGKLVYSNTFNSNNIQFNERIRIDNAKHGMYNLQLINNKKIYNQKLLIQ
ncbi:MAG: choice-of-anchor J domain-containing protein [Bacteroidales bacterium]|nr:choice-of-anchor J domain-containing protein [Bacteroidales bacterium]